MNLPKIVVIDENGAICEVFKRALSKLKNYTVVSFTSAKKAENYFSRKGEDTALVIVDMDLGKVSGADLMVNFKRLYPEVGFILMSGDPKMLLAPHITADFKFCKSDIGGRKILAMVRHVLRGRSMSPEAREKRFRCFSAWPGISRFAPPISEWDKKAEVEVFTTGPFRWNIYRLKEHVKAKTMDYTISVQSSIGCKVGCHFCQSRLNHFKRPLVKEELLAQIIYACDSHFLIDFFSAKEPLSLTVNFTAEGDLVKDNLDNGIEVIKLLNANKEISFNTIITTVGDERGLAKIASKRHIKHFRRTRFYWSLNSLDKNTRALLMPGTKDDDVLKIRELFKKISKKTGSKVTLSWVLIKGVNDKPEDAKALTEFIDVDKDFFEVKVQALVGDSGLEKPNRKDMVRFARLLDENHVPYRLRKIVGTKIKGGCGTTAITKEYRL